MKRNLLLLLLLLLFGILMPFMMLAQSGQVSVEEAQNLLLEDAILVDIRTSEEVAELAYVSEGMIQIPLSELASRYKELPEDKTLIIACVSGKRSKKAIRKLGRLGVKNAVNLEGGMNAWQGKGYPVIVDGVAPLTKACCAKGSGEAMSCCSGKEKSTGKADESKEAKACCSAKKN